MAKVATVKIELSLTSNVYRRSAPLDEKPLFCVTATLLTPKIATVELIGEFDTGTILERWFRMQHFNIHDIVTGDHVVNEDPFPGTCDPHADLYLRSVLELHASQPYILCRPMDEIDPRSDPIRDLKIGHTYRFKLQPQRILCYDRSIVDLFGKDDYVSRDELLPTSIEMLLASDDEVILKIEE
ncbi:hypothetical protein M409DRAFT_52176 [Zasmidium cellare ATCC 36951]|uniref:Uncharacterized protein n=1 Tax=Zasmidium cellare ATCC 36951 TaxID=1080233 RepID=A0A6A6CTZ8_ZASCE|nr:uncharacterized protein M409DRAFT_52176 [Zasmidium cellare ATCC 36951]KAF2169658.1 hypothetical protein M409DRAFT_52176 [Zasmidium cellare ATCC 36951]